MIKQLITDIAYDNIKLSQAITRAKLVENKIKNETLKKWLNKELEGYEFDDKYLPQYRKVSSAIYLTAEYPFGKIHKFPVLLDESFEDIYFDLVNFHRITEPISIVEQQIENLGEKAKGYIHLAPQLVQSIAKLFEDQVESRGGVVKSGTREIGKIGYQNVLEQTKQKLLDTLIELENLFPNLINDYQMTEENKDKVQNVITNNIYGSYNPMNIAAGGKVEQNGNNISISNTDSEKLKKLGLEDSQIDELRQIVRDNTKDKSTLTSKTMKWLGSVSSSIAAKGLYDNIPALTEFIEQVIK